MKRENYTPIQATDSILAAMRPGFITHLEEVLASTGEEKIPGGVIDGMVEKILENINFSNAMPEVTVGDESSNIEGSEVQTETSSTTVSPEVFGGAEVVSEAVSEVANVAIEATVVETEPEVVSEPIVRFAGQTIETFEEWVDRASQRLTA